MAGAKNSWSSGGPANAAVSALAVDPTTGTTIYAAVGGVFRSSDGGTTWSSIGPSGHSVTALAVGADHFVYAGTSLGGLFASGDNGGTWNELVADAPNSLYVAMVSFIRPDPADNDVLFVGRRGAFNLQVLGGVSRSTSHGASWVSVNSGLPVGEARAIAIDRTNGSNLLAAAGSAGLFKSINRGDAWVKLTGASTGAPLSDVVINPSNPAVVYVSILGLGVFKSTDGGATFSAASTGMADTQINQLAIDPARPASLYAGTPSGVFRSLDAGGSWAPFNNGLTNFNVRGLAVDLTGQFLHAATDAGVFDFQVVPDPTVLTLNPGRPFSVTLSARDQRTGRTATGIALAQGALFGYFSLPDFTGNSANPEVFLKILDGTSVNGKFWVFYGGLTDLEYTLTVTDDSTGSTKVYTKPAGSAAGGFDTSAFP